ncbi:hypothetical protein VTJ83DRAFT_592 [Remersonia thermophila]|uniref:F-box domain-containing protein n=1 Tax=Remersonia thermophila TaxID=72144 RepID=A0ABR4DMB6_9PEZI
MDIAGLPHDLFLLVIFLLSPRDCVRLRAVSRRWHAAFTDDFVSQQLLRWNFPRCRELRMAAAIASVPSPISSSGIWPRNLEAELVDFADESPSWSALFARVARRYHHLNKGRPRHVLKLDMPASCRDGSFGFSFWPVAPWHRFLRLNEKISDFHYPDPAWWYSQEDGVLVYPATADGADGAPSLGHFYRVVDLASGASVPVPWDVRSKHIRRVRLAQGVLIFEWAEALPHHQLNDRELVHRHFATAFDLLRTPRSAAAGSPWAVEFRSEWKLHFLGLPLNRSDRFFSAHTATHYAVYFWQPNRSLYQDDPIEQLAVWDISSPSRYRPSEDPTGARRPGFERTVSTPADLPGPERQLAPLSADAKSQGTWSLETATAGPQVIRRMAWRDLDFYGLRQRATPRLRNLALDGQNVYFIEEEHRWADGQHSSLVPPRVHFVQSTGIPVIPMTTTATGEPPEKAPPPAGDADVGHAAKPPPLFAIIDGPVYGPVWVDSCGADGDVNMNFCQRVAAAHGGAAPGTGPLPSSAVGGADVGRRSPPAPGPAGWPWAFGEPAAPASSVASAPPTRWPGWAPCWRHEDFPYLTVTEMVDYAAGVRIAARRCFMLEALSVHMRPTVAVTGATPPGEAKDAAKAARRRSGKAKEAPARSSEVYLPDDMWNELVAKGHIAGDERWVVGEDEAGRITVVRF